MEQALQIQARTTSLSPFPYEAAIQEVHGLKKFIESIMQLPHYKKVGIEGAYLIVQKAQVLGINVFDALNGDLYHMQGHIEMKAQLMNQLIRMAGHSVTIVKMDDRVCILKGKRADNGDEMEVSFGIEDATRAGLAQRDNYKKYPKAQFFARALSQLGRWLFPDVIKGCYVEGEIKDAIEVQPVQEATQQASPQIVEVEARISESQVKQIKTMLLEDEDALGKIQSLYNVKEVEELPVSVFSKVMNALKRRAELREREAEQPRSMDEVAMSQSEQAVRCRYLMCKLIKLN
jgi:hypothetical protein